MLEAVLYAEVYLICIIVVWLLLFWTTRSESRSAADQWMIRCYRGFLLTFAANFLFTLFYRRLIPLPEEIREILNYALKSLFFGLLSFGVFSWCGFAETEVRRTDAKRTKVHLLFIIPSLVPVAMLAANFWTHGLFHFNAAGEYDRGDQYHILMLYLFGCTMVFSVRLVARALKEFSPSRRSRMLVSAAFSLCILAAWLFSFFGEGLPVICVAIMVELLCIFVGTSQQQISLDKLTQVNNRQNLLGFINYKLANHESRLYLLMIDVDYFKSINDNYGHLEGDHALIRVAQVLKQSCANFKLRPFISRYGGDEFIIVLEGTLNDVNQLVDNIRSGLLASQEKEQSPYVLTCSIGVAGYRSGMQTKDFIAEADAEMYKIKQARDQHKHHP